MHGWMDEWMDGWMDGWMDETLYKIIHNNWRISAECHSERDRRSPLSVGHKDTSPILSVITSHVWLSSIDVRF